MSRSRPSTAQIVPVIRAEMVRASDGANMGDSISFASELILDDVYEVAYGSEIQRLAITPTRSHTFEVADDTSIGEPGARIHIDCTVTFMSPDGQTHEALLMVEVDEVGNAADIYVMPLGAMLPNIEYRLVGVDTENQLQKFAQIACVSFARGTHITLSSGEQRLIEELKVGDMILTRDDGIQPIRWIGESTVRAVGEMAPIRIAAGTLSNERDLVLSPDHRLFIYQRSDQVGVGRSELLIKVRHIVNGDTVVVQDGGFVDYFQLLFDSHQIIFAEGIAAESMLIDTRTKGALPEELSEAMGDVIPGHTDLPHAGLDVNEKLLRHPNAAEMLRKASTR